MQGFLSNLKNEIIKWCLEEQEITIEDFHNLNTPQNVAIDDYQGKLKFIEQSNNSKYLVKTDTGFSPIKSSFKTVQYQVYKLKLSNNLTLKCANTHIVMKPNLQEVFVKDLKPGDLVKTINGDARVLEVAILSEFDNMYDLELEDENHRFYTNGILSHNTTLAAIYILWFATFHEAKECVIASKNMGHAVDIMERIKFAYEELPNWLKAGCLFFNRTSIKFDNNSVIKSQATTEKTGRGNSPAILLLDEVSFVARKIQEKIWASIAPSLSTGGKLIMTTTPNGDQDLFARLWRGSISGNNNFKNITVLYTRHPDRGPESGYREDMIGKLGELTVRVELDCCGYETPVNSRIGDTILSTTIGVLYDHLCQREKQIREERNRPT